MEKLPKLLCKDNKVRDLSWPVFYHELHKIQMQGYDSVKQKPVVNENMTPAEKLYAINKELGMTKHGIISGLPIHDPSQDKEAAKSANHQPKAADVQLTPAQQQRPNFICTFPAWFAQKLSLSPKASEPIILNLGAEAKKSQYAEAMQKFKKELGMSSTRDIQLTPKPVSRRVLLDPIF